MLKQRQIQIAALVGLTVLLSGCERERDLPDEMHLTAPGAVYTGWIIVRADLAEEQRTPGYFSNEELDDPQGWIRITGLQWNSAGTRVPLVIDGRETGYEVELAQVVYGNSIPVLKLAVYQQGVERALAYTWAAPDSRRIGINLRWMQAGLTRR